MPSDRLKSSTAQGNSHSEGNSQRILVFGCGYLGLRVARKAVAQGHQVWGSTRDIQKGEFLRESGIVPIVADWTDRRSLTDLPSVDRLLVSVSFDPRSQVNRWEAQVGGLRNLLNSIAPETAVCYISTTGVFHQTDGRWVDETSPTRPTRASARAHLLGEALLHRLRPDAPWTVLRLAGIYGPGRIPRIADVRAGRPIHSPEHGFLNLIHVDDAADAVLSSWSQATERLYLVADDLPVVRRDYYRFIAQRCGAPEPQFLSSASSSPKLLRSESNKRVWNRRMKRDLIRRLRYPTYREGLTDLLSSAASATA